MTDIKLTHAQDRAIRIIVADKRAHGDDAAQYSIAPRQLARMLWPDSPAWNIRTRFRATSNQGALGGTMPMHAAKVLWKLREHHLVYNDDYLWRVTAAGERYVDGQ
ncbi:hypothetical protein [Curtobacterium sp. MCBD17_040]|uniref:hypothetical protein n=1 Tax=Curtobacterium sp. MCBD17_040 TaxID=2175674 RepID=UPI000DAA358A|nr:hypothetical protein [Curtobacterium sp. MCBD17_040]WIB65280.1 hypothetical protein DEI94_17905 [Curtobacterium sp. MCBD17_040]